MNLFSPDSKFSVITGTILDYIKLGLLFMLCSIPVITIGASYTAAIFVAMKIERGEAPAVGRPFLESFKSNFRQATKLTVILIVLYGMLAADWYLVMQMERTLPVRIATGLLFILVLLLTMVSLYIFPNLARYELSSRQIVRNSFIFALTHFGENIPALLILAAAFLLYGYLPAVIPIVICLAPALELFYMARLCVKVFRSLEDVS